MTRPPETCVARDVHVQQITGTGPLVAVSRLANRSRRPRDPGPAEHLPDRRVRKAGRRPNKPRPPTRRPTTGTNPLLQLRGELPRRAARPARAVKQRLGLSLTL